jgi:hypothetical protein
MPKAPKHTESETKKTTIRLPKSLWKEARIHGLEEGIDFQEIVSEGLRLFLNKHAGKKSGKGGKR